jgi:hypothetical protein
MNAQDYIDSLNLPSNYVVSKIEKWGRKDGFYGHVRPKENQRGLMVAISRGGIASKGGKHSGKHTERQLRFYLARNCKGKK